MSPAGLVIRTPPPVTRNATIAGANSLVLTFNHPYFVTALWVGVGYPPLLGFLLPFVIGLRQLLVNER